MLMVAKGSTTTLMNAQSLSMSVFLLDWSSGFAFSGFEEDFFRRMNISPSKVHPLAKAFVKVIQY